MQAAQGTVLRAVRAIKSAQGTVLRAVRGIKSAQGTVLRAVRGIKKRAENRPLRGLRGRGK